MRKTIRVIIAVAILSVTVQAANATPAEAATSTYNATAICSADLNTIRVGSTLGYFAEVYAELYQYDWTGRGWSSHLVDRKRATESVEFSGLNDAYHYLRVWIKSGWTNNSWIRVNTYYGTYSGWMFQGTGWDYCSV